MARTPTDSPDDRAVQQPDTSDPPSDDGFVVMHSGGYEIVETPAGSSPEQGMTAFARSLLEDDLQTDGEIAALRLDRDPSEPAIGLVDRTYDDLDVRATFREALIDVGRLDPDAESDETEADAGADADADADAVADGGFEPRDRVEVRQWSSNPHAGERGVVESVDGRLVHVRFTDGWRLPFDVSELARVRVAAPAGAYGRTSTGGQADV